LNLVASLSSAWFDSRKSSKLAKVTELHFYSPPPPRVLVMCQTKTQIAKAALSRLEKTIIYDDDDNLFCMGTYVIPDWPSLGMRLQRRFGQFNLIS
jgi:hypothetical protein